MLKTTSLLIICLFSCIIFSQSNENIYTKDGVLLGKKKDLIKQCANGMEAKSTATFDDKCDACECVLNLFSTYYNSKELFTLMNNGKNPFKEIFISDNPIIKTEFKECLGKYLKLLDTSKNLTTMTPNFSEDFIIACQYTMKTDYDKYIDINKYCECLDNEYSKKGITISKLKEFQDENSVSYNEILQKCVNVGSINKIKEDEFNTNDIQSKKTFDFVPIVNSGSLNKVKISFGKISKYFIIDSGASDTSISLEFERELILEGMINKSNYLDDGYYTIANGDQIKCRRVLLNQVLLGDFTINNVILSIRNTGSDLLMGKSILNKFEQWSIDNKNSLLNLKKRNIVLIDQVDYYEKGIENYESEDYATAIKNLTLALDIDAKNVDAYFKRGIAKSILKDYTGAIFDFTKMIEITPNEKTAYYNRGIIKARIKDYKGAIYDFTKLVELDPNNENGYYNRGLAKSDLNDNAGAIADYTKAILINPKHINAYVNRGIAKLHLKDKNGGCLDFNKAKDLGDKKANDIIRQFCN